MADLKIIYRTFKLEDSEQVWDLHVTALKETRAYVECATLNNLDKDLKDIENVYLKNRGAFIVAILGDEIIGMGALKKINNEIGEIKRMRVYKKFQGQGVERQLLKILETEAIKLGYKKLILDTSDKQEIAQKFYEKYGYKETNRRKDEFGMGLELIFYEKPLERLLIKPVETPKERNAYHKIRKVDIFEENHPNVEYDDDHPDEKIPQNHPHVFIFKEEVIGAVRLDKLGENIIGIRMFGIRGKYQKKWFGTQAVKLIEEYAREKGCTKLVLNANKNSVIFYEKKGFIKDFWEGDSNSYGEKYNHINLWKNLKY